jgi:hypothetical protein
MKKTLITTCIVVVAAFIVLYVLNKVTSKKNPTEFYTAVQKGQFEITVSSSGELIA